MKFKSNRARVVGEPLDAEGRRWPIVIQEAGPWLKQSPSGRQLFTAPEALRAAVNAGLFEGVKSFLNHETPTEERERPERDQGLVIGVVTDTRFDESMGQYGAAVGVLNIVDRVTHERVVAAHELGILDRVGSFSITAHGMTEPQTIGGIEYDVIVQFDASAPASVDFVTEPAAGGRFLVRLAASLARTVGVDAMTWSDFVNAKPGLAKLLMRSADLDELSEQIDNLELFDGPCDELDAFKRAAAEAWDTERAESSTQSDEPTSDDASPSDEPEPQPEAKADAPAPAQPNPADVEKVVQEQVAAALRKMRHQQRIEAALKDVPVRLRDAARVALRASSPMDDVTKLVRPFMVSEFNDSFPGGGGGKVEAGSNAWDKYVAGVDGFFARKDVELNGDRVPRFRNFREVVFYHPANRQHRIPTATDLQAAMQTSAGFRKLGSEDGGTVLRASGRVKLTASITTSTHAEIFADRAWKRMAKLYHSSNMVRDVEAMASNVTEYDDFKAHRIILLGEYANPSSVSEGSPYATATSPTDLEETISLTKYGFIDDVSFEALTDPDGQKLAKLPDRMIGAVLRLERQTILNTITTTNPTMNQDSTTLYHANHNNTGTTALTIDGLNAVSNAMRQQTSQGASEQIGAPLEPKFLVIAPELKGLAKRILNPSNHFFGPAADMGASATLDATLFTDLTLVVLDHATDANDWYVVANPALVETFEVARLRGVREPEFFVQDKGDTAFQSDTVMWKVRTFIGAAPIDYRAFYRQVVT